MFNKKTIRDIDVKGNACLVRVDFNVPIKEGKVTDDTRIRAALPTIKYLLEHGAALMLCSHLGRPKGGPDPKYSLRPVAAHLSGLLGKPVAFAEDALARQPRLLPKRSSQAMCWCWKTLVSTRARQRTTLTWHARWQPWPICMSMMPLALPTARIPLPRAWRASCPRWRVS